MTIIWCMIPEIWSVTDRFFCRILDQKTVDIIISQRCTKNHDHMLHCSLDMVCNGFNCYFTFWAIFYTFTYLTAKKLKTKKNGKKPWRHYHFTIVYHKSWSYMLYCSWDMVCDGCNYFSFWAIFCPFTSLTAQKIKIFENMKKTVWRHHHFT